MKRFLTPALCLALLAAATLLNVYAPAANSQVSSPYARRVPAGTSDPASAADGYLFNRTDTNRLRLYNDGAWADVGNPGTVTGTGTAANAFSYWSGSSSLGSTAAATDGQLLIGRTGNTPQAATLTAGSGVTITNGAGSITIAASGGGSGDAPLGSQTVDLNSTTPVVVYTVPPGRSAVPVRSLAHSFTCNPADTDTSAINVSASGSAITFTHSVSTFAGSDRIDLRLLAAGQHIPLAAGATVSAAPNTAAGSDCTAVITVFGYQF
jgi:hypothetical protein